MSTHDRGAPPILCEPGLPEGTSHCTGGAGIPGTSETCIQMKYSKDLQFYCSSCTVLCSSLHSSSFCRAAHPAFQLLFPPPVSKLWSLEELSFPWRNNPDIFVWVYFPQLASPIRYWLQWWLAPTLSSAFKKDLLWVQSRDKTSTLYVSASCSTEVSYMCGIATGQMAKPYALSPYLDTAGNLTVSLLFHLSLGKALAKHCLGPCDISLHLLFCCWWLAQCKTIWRFHWMAVHFSTGTYHFTVLKKLTLSGLILTAWVRAHSLC